VNVYYKYIMVIWQKYGLLPRMYTFSALLMVHSKPNICDIIAQFDQHEPNDVIFSIFQSKFRTTCDIISIYYLVRVEVLHSKIQNVEYFDVIGHSIGHCKFKKNSIMKEKLALIN